MTDEALETPEDSRMSRRNALKAAVGVGVGAVAWSGPQITSFGATPAYAAGCTGFTLQVDITDINTDSSSGCSAPWEMYHNPNVDGKIQQAGYDNDDYFTNMDPGLTGVCTGPTDTTRYRFYHPTDEVCSFTITLYYASDAQGNPSEPFYGEETATTSGTEGGRDYLNILWPAYEGDVSTIDNSSLRYAISITCYKDSDSACVTPATSE